MTRVEWEEFSNFRSDFCDKCKLWSTSCGVSLDALLQKAYPIEKVLGSESNFQNTPIVYNGALDKITQYTTIRLILIADNPGKNERLKRQYLIGNAGKLAANFFNTHADLAISFPREVLILNKTPFHSFRTADLKYIQKIGDSTISDSLNKSMEYMARATFLLHKTFNVPLWIVGYSELGERGVFAPYSNTLINLYKGESALWESVFLFQHFSMNRFSIDYNNYCKAVALPPYNTCTTRAILQQLGNYHKEKIFPPSVIC